MKTEFSYVVLRYVHDVVSGEFANVGVIVVAPRIRFARALCTQRYQRISQFFPGASGKHVREVSSYIQERIDEIADEIAGKQLVGFPRDADEFAGQVLPKDDSSFQTSGLQGGVAEGGQMEQTVEDLFERFVEKYEKIQERKTRTDNDVWRPFKRALDSKRLSAQLAPYVVRSPHCEFEFQKTFRNGRLHVCAPISFDLASESEISDKALLWFGRIQQLSESKEKFKSYFLLGKPCNASLVSAFQNAQAILQDVDTEKAVYTEEAVDEFAAKVAEELVSAHWQSDDGRSDD